MLQHIAFFIYCLLTAPFAALLGHRRQTYTIGVNVDAPAPDVWHVASAHTIKLDGLVPIDIATEPDPYQPSLYRGTITIADRVLKIAYRVLEERPGEAMLLRVLKDGSDPQCCPGEDLIVAVGIKPTSEGTRLVTSQEITHTSFWTRLSLPLAVIQNAYRIKRNAEARSGKQGNDAGRMIKAALITGALTFGSFLSLFGWSSAAILVGLIFVHELGHVLAMRWLDIPVRGMYFIPFFGGVAVGDRHRDEGERGLVAIMGPAFSIITTAIFAFMAINNPSPVLIELAILSALINGFNLLPVLPLDGGQIVAALLSRAEQSFAKLVHLIGLITGLAISVYLESFMLGTLLLLTAPSIFSDKDEDSSTPPISKNAAAMLVIAYLATIAFYGFVLWRLMGPAMANPALT